MWPSFFNDLNRKFQLINTHLTFLSSFSRQTIPTLELLQKLDNDISSLDLQMIKQLFPAGDVAFGYFYESQILLQHADKQQYLSEKGYHQSQPKSIEDAYKQVAEQREDIGEERQLLVFEFCDVRTNAITAIVKGKRSYPSKKLKTLKSPGPDFFQASKSMDMALLSQAQIQAIIRSRNDRFRSLIQKHLDKFSESELEEGKAFKSLVEQCSPNLPKPWGLVDPVSNMEAKQNQANANRMEKPTAEEMLDSLKEKPLFKDQIRLLTTWNEIREASFETINSSLINSSLSEALWRFKEIDINDGGLYSHQVQALTSIIEEGKHVIVSTSTSSGKSLIYQVPILNDILNSNTNTTRRTSTALLIFPTKALAQDQLRHFKKLISHLPDQKRKIIVDTYDGDTCSKDRAYIRNYADIIFTNPDAIHAAILPLHSEQGIDSGPRGWNDFLSNLKYVIVDELHVYKSTFGVHVSYVMARLNRMHHIISNSEKAPIYISCSATINNPTSHFRTICAIPVSEEIVHISLDGSPSAQKKMVVWEPPILMNKKGQREIPQKTIKDAASTGPTLESPIKSVYLPRESVISELAKILVHLLCFWPTIKIIVFCPIRVVCELLTKEAKALIADSEYPEWSSLSEHDIMAYRGGYSKSDRRAIEQKMFKGHLRAIIATNALELGIDLSDLDVVISCGFPHLKANLHQQFGRAGRGKFSRGSLCILVCGSNPVDRYYLNNQDELLDKESYQDLCVDGLLDGTSNQMIMSMHLQCAAFEWPIDLERDIKWFSPRDNPNLNESFYDICINKLIQDKKCTYQMDPRYLPWPSEKVSLRAIELNMFAVVDVTANRNKVIEEVEELRTSFTLYDGGIFLHQGLPYLVKEFNPEKRFAKVERVKVSWVTQQRDFSDVDPMEIELVKQLKSSSDQTDVPIFYGKIQITTIVFGFFKVSRSMEILEAVEVSNPPVVFKSKGFWVDVPNRAIQAVKEKSLNPAGAIHAAQHAIMNVLPVYISNGATNNPNARWSAGAADAEISTECKAPEKEFAKRQSTRQRPARLIFHDTKGGEQGTGISAKTFEYIDEIMAKTFEAVSTCECDWGCPMCVAGSFCKELMLVMSKPGAIIVLGALLGKDIQELKDAVKDGPEPNMPLIATETISSKGEAVKLSPTVKIVPDTK